MHDASLVPYSLYIEQRNPKDTDMNKVYQAARAAYKAQEFTNFSIVTDEDKSAAVYREGKFVALYASRLLAEQDIAKQVAKASKFIH